MKSLIISFLLLISFGVQAQSNPPKKEWKERQERKFVKKCLKKYAKKHPKKELTKEVEAYCGCLQEKLEAEELKLRQAKKTEEIKFIKLAKECYNLHPIDTTTVNPEPKK